MKIGILTGGGDTSSLDAILYGAAQESSFKGAELIGFKRGWKGVLNPVDYLTLPSTIIDPSQGGTLLRSSRTKLSQKTIDEAVENIQNNVDTNVDAFIAIGGDDTLLVGRTLAKKLSIPTCFITKTIDNDVGRNAPPGDLDYDAIINYLTPGFGTAASKAALYAAELRTTSYSHERIMFLETMGRIPGWLALSSYKGNPDFILIPEVPLDFNIFKEKVEKRYKEKSNVVIVVAEGVRYKGSSNPILQDSSNIDAFGHAKLGGVAQILAERIKNDLKVENSNYVNPNYLYRSGSPTKTEMAQGIMLGKEAVNAVTSDQSSQAAVLQRRGEYIMPELRPIDEVLSTDKNGRIIPRTVDMRFYDAENYAITDLGREYFRLIK